jgi:F-type H+-transporting ATPase subunit b
MGLGIDLSILITQIINFVLLLLLLYLVAYKPVMRMLDERAKRIKEGIAASEQAKEQAVHAEEEVKKQMEAASKQAQEIITRAGKAGEDLRLKAQEDARKDAEMLIAKARGEIKNERDEAVQEIRQQFAELTILAASKVIGETLDKKAHKELIEKVLKEADTVNKSNQ